MSNSSHTFSRHPLLILFVYFVAGIGIGSLIDHRMTIAVTTVIVTIAVSIFFRQSARLLLPLLFFPLGIICYHVELSAVASDRIRTIYSDGLIASGEPVEVEGVVIEPPEPAYDGQFVKLRVDHLIFKQTATKVSGDVRLFAAGESEDVSSQLDLMYGDRVRVMCRLMREEKFRNPGGRSRIESLDQQGIDATAIIKSPLLVEKLGSESVFLPLGWIQQRRRDIINAFRDNLSAPTAGVMIASLLGDKHFLDRETSDVFRDGGTFHVLVISGLHITFIGSLTFWIVSLFTRRPMWQCLLPAGLLWAYTIAVGADVPVVRASLMFSLFLGSRLLYRDGSLLNALGACGLVLVVWRPSDLFTASFQLTFVSVAAIVACAFPMVEKLRSIGRWVPTSDRPFPPNVSKRLRRFCETLYWNEVEFRIENSREIWSANLFKSPYLARWASPIPQTIASYIFEGLLVSLIVQLWMLPLLVTYFHRFTPASLFLNLWVGVFLALESFAAVFGVLIAKISVWLAAPLFAATEFFNRTMMSLPTWLSTNDLAGFRVPVYSGSIRAVYFVYAAAVVIAGYKVFSWDIQSRMRTRVSIYALESMISTLALLILFHPFSSPRPDGRLTVDFLDVGQGDSAFVTFPTGETMLVDGGGQMDYRGDEFQTDSPRIGEAVVSEFLWEKGYSSVDYLVATHADADHVQGLVDVARNFHIGKLFIGAAPGNESHDLLELLSELQKHSVPIQAMNAGDQLTIGGVQIDFLNPDATNTATASDNNGSVVMKLSLGERSFLLTGDIEREAEFAIVHRNDRLHADVLKVAHHGSRTSSTAEFVNAVSPTIAVISVGRRSRFGHPHREVVEGWVNAGAKVGTTGESGTITISTDGSDLQVKTFVQ